ncbi:Rft protein-domain-containing protein [Obelidium mucronatum]|nr:Rft protein-domain-containing protein [Obelidium mucronatum]
MSTFLKGAGQLMALNVWSRLLTFALNQFALRFITRSVLGIVSMEMELLLATVLFLARECIRMALLRSESTLPPPTTESHKTTIMTVQTIHAPPKTNQSGIPSNRIWNFAILIFLGAALVELISEPFYSLGVNNLYFSVRVRIEGAAVLFKCFVAIGLLKWASARGGGSGGGGGVVSEEEGVLAFAWSQMAYAFVLAVSYVLVFLAKYRNVMVESKGQQKLPQGISLLLPRVIEEADGNGVDRRRYFIDPTLSGLAWTFAKQGLFKHFLTEGDKILSVTFITAAIQGDYSLVEKYGSIVARLLFQPIEEMSRVFFSKTLSSLKSNADNRDKTTRKQDSLKALTLLTIVLRLYILLSLYFLAFGTNYTALLIDLLASRTFSTGSAPSVFNAYMLYIPLLAVNGVTEAFLQSVAPESVLMKQSYWMAVCWVVFFATGWFGISVAGLAGVGVVLANSLNMAMRIWFAWGFVRGYFEGVVRREEEMKEGDRNTEETKDVVKFKKDVERLLDVSSLVPKSIVVWAVFGAAWAVTYTSNETIGWQTLTAKAQHISVGVLMFLVTTISIYFTEKQLLIQVKQFYKSMK